MANVRNYEEYRAEVLDRLGDDYTVEDLRNTERWRLRVLDMLSGGGSGGGGESDFSTAEVTVNVSADYPNGAIGINIPCIAIDDEFIRSSESIYAEQGETITESIILYKGKAQGAVKNFSRLDPKPTVNIDGNATYDTIDGYFVITGDCTITIS